eukprot:scaffold181389_cov64-Attheya_sp.AAC.1
MTGAFEDFYRIHKMVRGANMRDVFDFTGTGPQVLGNHKALPAVTYFYSAVIYSLWSFHIQPCQAGMAFTVGPQATEPATDRHCTGTIDIVSSASRSA